MTILRTSPEMVAPDLVIELDAITAMNGGTLAGGPELFPGSVAHVPPQAGGVVLVISAKPLNAAGAGPPLSELTFAHFAPQKVTAVPTAESRLPITKEPPAPPPKKANTKTGSVSDDGRKKASLAKLAATVFGPSGWLTTMLQDAVPLELVVPVHDCAPAPLPSVKVSVRLEIGV